MNLTTYLIVGVIFAMLMEFTDSKGNKQLKGKGIFPRLILIAFWPILFCVSLFLIILEYLNGKNNNRRRPF